MTTAQSASSKKPMPRSQAETEKFAKRTARRILKLQRELAVEEAWLKELLGQNGKVTVDAGTFQAVPVGWRPNGKLTAFLLERKLLAACLVQKPVISMAKVNELAQRRTELAAFLTLQRASAAGRLALRFRAATQEDEEPADEG